MLTSCVGDSTSHSSVEEQKVQPIRKLKKPVKNFDEQQVIRSRLSSSGSKTSERSTHVYLRPILPAQVGVVCLVAIGTTSQSNSTTSDLASESENAPNESDLVAHSVSRNNVLQTFAVQWRDEE